MMEKLLKAFRELGFLLDYEEDSGYSFKFEDVLYVLMPSDTDPNFLNIAIPGVLDRDSVSPEVYVAIVEHLNSTLKYVKAYSLGGSLWLFYEREMFENDNLVEVIGHMIHRLDSAYFFLNQELHGSDSNTDDEDGDEAEVEAEDYQPIDENEPTVEGEC